ncbi:hypothetical protein EJ08DRAFT_697797 [Tothia fuscella]|uniref:Uncharacterized protein n=1 Tax=Tothia fuscella TaxID=1048955 RepID=A0A9P4NRI9_9PEZI|nr:hypothetical protein EJ08DRAFT_697797 [Tothia fuscella]
MAPKGLSQYWAQHKEWYYEHYAPRTKGFYQQASKDFASPKNRFRNRYEAAADDPVNSALGPGFSRGPYHVDYPREEYPKDAKASSAKSVKKTSKAGKSGKETSKAKRKQASKASKVTKTQSKKSAGDGKKAPLKLKGGSPLPPEEGETEDDEADDDQAEEDEVEDAGHPAVPTLPGLPPEMRQMITDVIVRQTHITPDLEAWELRHVASLDAYFDSERFYSSLFRVPGFVDNFLTAVRLLRAPDRPTIFASIDSIRCAELARRARLADSWIGGIHSGGAQPEYEMFDYDYAVARYHEERISQYGADNMMSPIAPVGPLFEYASDRSHAPEAAIFRAWYRQRNPLLERIGELGCTPTDQFWDVMLDHPIDNPRPNVTGRPSIRAQLSNLRDLRFVFDMNDIHIIEDMESRQSPVEALVEDITFFFVDSFHELSPPGLRGHGNHPLETLRLDVIVRHPDMSGEFFEEVRQEFFNGYNWPHLLEDLSQYFQSLHTIHLRISGPARTTGSVWARGQPDPQDPTAVPSFHGTAIPGSVLRAMEGRSIADGQEYDPDDMDEEEWDDLFRAVEEDEFQQDVLDNET